MKKLGITILLLFTCMVMVYGADKTKAQIKFEKTTFDFGNIREDGGPVTHEFIFKNESASPTSSIGELSIFER